MAVGYSASAQEKTRNSAVLSVRAVIGCISLQVISKSDYLHRHLGLSALSYVRVKMGCDGIRAETRFGLPAKRTSPFISAGVSVQSSTGFLGVRVGEER